jgi:hypothetical protein
MIFLFVVALAWTGAHNAAWPDHAPQFREDTAVARQARIYRPAPPVLVDQNGLPVDPRHHAQRGDGGPTGWQERRFHGLE